MRDALCAVLVAVLALLPAACGDAADSTYTDSMHREHANDSTAASGMVAEPAVPVQAETVAYAVMDGDSVQGYMAYPAAADSFAQAGNLNALPAVVIIHEWWGLNDNIRAMARRLAGEGFRVLAVDLYGAPAASSPDSARALMQRAMERQPALTDNLVQAYRTLESRFGAPAVGMMGWCFGGAQTLQGALALSSDLDAAVIYYGRLEQDPQRLTTLDMPILGFFGGKDEGIPVEGVRRFESTLDSLGKSVEVHVYDDAGHAFANPSGGNYVEEAASDSWTRTVAFLKEHLHTR